jgi:2-dehydro-3-deoxyglucarate aldolase/4-hydroxy-2-oxoheptanedioate aldolase
MTLTFLQKIQTQPPAVGLIVSLQSPEVAEILSQCGYDWLFIDMEHGQSAFDAVQHMLQAVRGTCSAIVRVPEGSPVWIKKALDMGVDGLIIPQVNTADHARAVVAAVKYPPLGARSVGVMRANNYGMDFADYVQHANERTALIIQIEHIEAVRNADAILAVPGIDAVLIGPYDLSGSMNLLGQVTSDPVQGAITTIKHRCHAAGMPLGIFVMTPEAARQHLADGCRFVAVGTDTTLLWNAAKREVAAIKGT